MPVADIETILPTVEHLSRPMVPDGNLRRAALKCRSRQSPMKLNNLTKHSLAGLITLVALIFLAWSSLSVLTSLSEQQHRHGLLERDSHILGAHHEIRQLPDPHHVKTKRKPHQIFSSAEPFPSTALWSQSVWTTPEVDKVQYVTLEFEQKPIPHAELHALNYVAQPDTSKRCSLSHICEDQLNISAAGIDSSGASGRHAGVAHEDGVDARCGPSGLACITDAAERAERVKEAMRWSWKGYREQAWGHDEMGVRKEPALRSSEQTPEEALPVDWMFVGLTSLDAMDTLLMMGMQEEYVQARGWAVTGLDFDSLGLPTSVFEVNIRILGVLLSSFYMSGGDAALLERAVDLGERLLVALNTTYGVARVTADLSQTESDGSSGEVGRNNIAAVGTLTMEMTTLSRITGRPEFARSAYAFWHLLPLLESCDGLYCTWFDADKMKCEGQEMGMGASADSVYEYMLKQWAMSGKRDTRMLQLYERAMAGMRRQLVTELTSQEAPDKPFWIVSAGNKAGVSASCVGDEEGGGDLGAAARDVWSRHLADMAAAERKMERTWSDIEDSTAVERRADAVQLGALKQRHRAAGVKQLRRHVEAALKRPTRALDSQKGVKRSRSRQAVTLTNELQHFTCFVPGMLVLGHQLGVNTSIPGGRAADPPSPPRRMQRHQQGIQETLSQDEESYYFRSDGPPADQSRRPPEALVEDDLVLAARLMTACYDMYRSSPTGVSPDVVAWSQSLKSEFLNRRGHDGSAYRRLRSSYSEPTQEGVKKADMLDSEGGRTSQGAAAANRAARSRVAAGEVSPARGQLRGLAGRETASSEEQLEFGSAEELSADPYSLLLDKLSWEDDSRAANSGYVGEEEGAGAESAGSSVGAEGQPLYVMSIKDAQSYLRPEVLESIYYLWMATKHEVYREWAWAMFIAVEHYCRVETGGYSRLADASSRKPVRGDRMESFWLAETLKYFWLIFLDDPNVMPLEQFVFNTEAHPLPVWGSRAESLVLNKMNIVPLEFDPWMLSEDADKVHTSE